MRMASLHRMLLPKQRYPTPFVYRPLCPLPSLGGPHLLVRGQHIHSNQSE